MKLFETVAVLSCSLAIFPAASMSAVVNPPPAIGRPSYQSNSSDTDVNVNGSYTNQSSIGVPPEGWTCTKLAHKVTFHTYWKDKSIFRPLADKFMQSVQDDYYKTLEDFGSKWEVNNHVLTFEIEQATGQADAATTTASLDDYTVLAAIQCATAWVKLWPIVYKGTGGVPDTDFDVMDTNQAGQLARGSFGWSATPISS